MGFGRFSGNGTSAARNVIVGIAIFALAMVAGVAVLLPEIGQSLMAGASMGTLLGVVAVGLGVAVAAATVLPISNPALAAAERTQASLAAEHRLSKSALNLSKEAVIVTNRDGMIRDWNTAANTLFGALQVDMDIATIGTQVVSRVDGQTISSELMQRFALATKGEVDDWPELYEYHKKGGAIVPLEVKFSVLVVDEATSYGIISITDLTKTRENEALLDQARSLAVNSEKVKSRFMTVMSHELRTPLNGIIAGVELLKETTELDERQKWLANILEECGTSALEQVSNLLELTRLSGDHKPNFRTNPFSPVDTIKVLLAKYTPLAVGRGNSVKFNEPIDALPKVIGTERLFQNVVSHFMSNAVKFTENGTVQVDLTTSIDREAGTVHLQLSISDTGIGIAEENLDRIFENFETVDNSYTRVGNGSGLGLAIAKRSSEVLGGKIFVDSTEGAGSKFTLSVTLPLALQDAKEPAKKPSADLLNLNNAEATSGIDRPLRVLVAEDNEVNRNVLIEILHVDGHEVVEAADGQEAVEIAAREHFDAILMDISMPRLDGMSATNIIRSSGMNTSVPIIGVTAHALPDQIDGFLAAGMDDVIVKPIRKNAIRAVLYRAHLKRQATSRKAPPPKPKGVKRDMSIGSSNLIDAEVFDSLKEILDTVILQGYVEKFRDECESALIAMRSLLREGDLNGAASAAHKAAGVAATVGAASIQKMLNEFEVAARDNKPDACAPIPDKIEPLISRAADQLSARLV